VPREGELLLLHLSNRERCSAPGSVRNHWRRLRIEAAQMQRRLGRDIPDYMLVRMLDERLLRVFRLAHARVSLDGQPPNKSLERTREG
jgi:hypothetical protein